MAFDAVTYAAAKQSAKQYTDQKVSELPSSYTYKGKVATAANLPLSGNTKGDLWITEDDGHEYVWSIDAASGSFENWVDKSKDISNKIDKPEDQANNDTLIYDEENDTWVASSLKSINGQSLLGNGDVEIKTYQAYPSVWQTSGTLEEVTESMLQYPQYTKKGMAYLGGISGTCVPFGEGNAECIVSFMLDGIAVLSVNSSNIAPYRWEYNTASYDYTWKKSADVVANPTQTAVNPLTKISIDGELYKIEGKEYAAGTNITITNDTINAKDTTYSAGANVVIDANNVISAPVQYISVEGTSGTFTEEQITLLSNNGLAYILVDGKRFNYHSSSFSPRVGIVSIYSASSQTSADIVTVLIGTKEWSLTTSQLQSALSAGANVQINNNVVSAVDTKYAAGSNITITENGSNGDPVISAKDTTYTAGTHVSITNEVITADDNLQQQITVTNAIGDIAAGEVLPVGTSLEQIVRRMLAGSTPPVTGVSFYWGAIDEDVPTLASLDELQVSIGLNKETLIANGLEKNIVSYYIPSLDLGQTQMVAVTNSLKVKDWKNKATGWSYKGNYTEIALGSFNVYYFNQRVDSEPDGEDMLFEFEEA